MFVAVRTYYWQAALQFTAFSHTARTKNSAFLFDDVV
jgi:hypothetical protein